MPDKSLEDYSPEQLAEMGQVYAKLISDPATRELTLRSTKKISPGTPIPEIDLMDQFSAFAKPHIDKIDKLEREKMERDAADRLREKRAVLAEKGYDKDQISAIEKVMLEKHIPDHETAAEHFTMQSKLATPTPDTFKPQLPRFDKDKIKEAGGLKNYFRNDAYAAIDDLRSGKVKLH